MANPAKKCVWPLVVVLSGIAIYINLASVAFAIPSGDEQIQEDSRSTASASEQSSIKPDQNSGVIEYRVRDSETGYAIQATLKYADVEEGWTSSRSASTDAHGRIRLELPPAHYLIEVSAPGFERASVPSHVIIDNTDES